METPDKKELITEISELFKAHEEPYETGSWEDFSRQRRERRAIPFIWIGTAAALLLVVFVLPFVFKTIPVRQSVAVHQDNLNKSLPSILEKDTLSTRTNDIKKEISGQKGIVVPVGAVALNPQIIVSLKTSDHSIVQKSIPLAEKSDSAVYEENMKSGIAIAAIPADKEPIKAKESNETGSKEPVKKQDFLDYLRKEAKSEKVVKTKPKPSSRWDFGVEVSPTMLQSKMNMGAGITTEYRLSKSFSLSSGIAYVALDAGKSITPQSSGVQSYAMDAESNKKLVSVEANIQAIDIPIALTYTINKNLYTSIGVSYFGVFSEKRGNKYLTELEVSNSLQNLATGKIETFQSVLSQKNNEVSTDLPLKGNSYLGFFNFSVGHKQEIFNRYNIIVEPFLKVPVGKLSTQDLKLTNGGVKLKFSF